MVLWLLPHPIARDPLGHRNVDEPPGSLAWHSVWTDKQARWRQIRL